MKLSINFLLPFSAPTGGVSVVARYAEELCVLGHNVTIYSPIVPYVFLYEDRKKFCRVFKCFTKQLLNNIINLVVNMILIKKRRRQNTVVVPFFSDLFIRKADVTVATAWATAYSLLKLNKSRGKKAYFIQGIETWGANPDLALKSYSLPFYCISISPWLSEQINKKTGCRIPYLVLNGVDTRWFRPGIAKDFSAPVILMMTHPAPIKGTDDGLAVLKVIHEFFPKIPIHLFGMAPLSIEVPFAIFHQSPQPDELRALYQSATIYLNTSQSEGWGLTSMEALACGCALVATRVGCIPLISEKHKILTVEPGDRDGLLGHLEYLIKNPLMVEKMAQEEPSIAADYPWEKSTQCFLNVMHEIAQKE